MLVATVALHDGAHCELHRAGGWFYAIARLGDRTIRGKPCESRQAAWDDIDGKINRRFLKDLRYIGANRGSHCQLPDPQPDTSDA